MSLLFLYLKEARVIQSCISIKQLLLKGNVMNSFIISITILIYSIRVTLLIQKHPFFLSKT